MLTRRQATAAIAATALAIGAGDALRAEDMAARPLPPPRSSGGMALIDALKLRRSTRAYSDRPLEPQDLSDLLWARRTASIVRAATALRPIGGTSW